jgi:Carboxypeptidase regulatory-like domain
LIHRGLGPQNTSSLPQGVGAAVPAALARDTLRAILELVASRSIDDLVSVSALSYAQTALHTMRLIRVTLISALVIGGLVVASGASLMIPRQESARPATASKATAKEGLPGAPFEIRKSEEVLFLHVVDINGQGAPNVEVKVQGRNTMQEARLFRTGQGGWLKMTVDDFFDNFEFEARPDAQTIGWAHIASGELTPTGRENNPAQMVLLPRNHRVEGSVVDVRGEPIGGVVVQVVQLDHDINRFASSYGLRSEGESLGQAITDEAGRYTLTLPHDTRAIFLAYHRRYVGPMFSSKPEDHTVKPVTLQDAGGIAGTVIDLTTKEPVAGAKVAAQIVEHGEQFVGGGGGVATSDARGHFVVGGLAPSVYNLLFSESPKGKMFVARAVEGVRVKAGEDARADLALIKGRRLQGTAFDSVTKKPMAGVPIASYNLSYPRSGAACQGTTTDHFGHFELFVPPGPTYVYISRAGFVGRHHTKNLIVADEKDPEHIILERRYVPEEDVPFRPMRVSECAVHVRVASDGPAKVRETRTLTGRIVDPAALPIASVRVYYNSMKFVEAATDRLGMFRLKDLPQGEFRIGIDKEGYGHGWAKISPDAREVDITLLRSAEPY